MAAAEPGRAPDPTLLFAPSDPPVAPAEPAPPAADPRIGTVLKDTYHVLRRLGEGGMGTVYLAEHRSIRKKVAVKVLGAAYSQRPELAERFLREARAAAMIASPHVIEIHDFGTTPDGAAFFVMEYLQGEDLGDLLRREGPLPWPRVRPILAQLCAALQAAHEQGVVHRDMKPENCFRLERGDVVKVLDFGIAKVASDEADGGRSLTRTGMIFGTPEYMSPEQAQGVPHDHRVDVYATGVILFQMLTGRLPFAADNFMGLLNQHMFEAPPRPSSVCPAAQIPADVEAIVLKALQKDPALRFQTMAEFAAAIAAVGTGAAPVVVVAEPSRPRPRPGEAIAFRDAPTLAADVRVAPRPAPAPRRGWPAIAAVVVAAGVTAAVLTAGAPPAAPPPEPALLPLDPPAPIAATHPALLPIDPPRAEHPALLPLDPPAPSPASQPVPPVSLQIRTGTVVATVLDGEGRVLGTTAAGVSVPRGAEPIELVLRADGYQDVRVAVTPDRDQTIDRAGALRRKSGKPGKPASKPATAAAKKPPDNSDLMPLD